MSRMLRAWWLALEGMHALASVCVTMRSMELEMPLLMMESVSEVER